MPIRESILYQTLCLLNFLTSHNFPKMYLKKNIFNNFRMTATATRRRRRGRPSRSTSAPPPQSRTTSLPRFTARRWNLIWEIWCRRSFEICFLTFKPAGKDGSKVHCLVCEILWLWCVFSILFHIIRELICFWFATQFTVFRLSSANVYLITDKVSASFILYFQVQLLRLRITGLLRKYVIWLATSFVKPKHFFSFIFDISNKDIVFLRHMNANSADFLNWCLLCANDINFYFPILKYFVAAFFVFASFPTIIVKFVE